MFNYIYKFCRDELVKKWWGELLGYRPADMLLKLNPQAMLNECKELEVKEIEAKKKD